MRTRDGIKEFRTWVQKLAGTPDVKGLTRVISEIKKANLAYDRQRFFGGSWHLVIAPDGSTTWNGG